MQVDDDVMNPLDCIINGFLILAIPYDILQAVFDCDRSYRSKSFDLFLSIRVASYVISDTNS